MNKFLMAFLLTLPLLANASDDYAVDDTFSDGLVAAPADPNAQPEYSVKPLNEKYNLEGLDSWKLLYQDNQNQGNQTQYFQNDLTVNDGVQLVEAWVKSTGATKKPYEINYYQILCKDQTFKVLEQYQSKDDQDYKLVKKVDNYRQTQPLNQAGEKLPVFKKLCQEREDFAKAWGIKQ